MIDVVFTIPRNLWVSMNRATSGHGHTARIRREIQAIAAITLRNARVEPIAGRVTVVWTVHYPKGVSYKHGDPVNASPVTKPLLDAAVTLGILKGDGPNVVASETFIRGENLPEQKQPHQIRMQLKEAT